MAVVPVFQYRIIDEFDTCCFPNCANYTETDCNSGYCSKQHCEECIHSMRQESIEYDSYLSCITEYVCIFCFIDIQQNALSLAKEFYPDSDDEVIR